MEFHLFERAIEEVFAPYQNRVLNELEPFDAIMPTLENMVDYFGMEFRKIVKRIGGRLMSIEGSETPTRSYIIKFNDAQDSQELEEYTEDVMQEVIDTVLNDILLDIGGTTGE